MEFVYTSWPIICFRVIFDVFIFTITKTSKLLFLLKKSIQSSLSFICSIYQHMLNHIPSYLISWRNIIPNLCLTWLFLEIVPLLIELMNIFSQLLLSAIGMFNCKITILLKMNPFAITQLFVTDFHAFKGIFIKCHHACKIKVRCSISCL